jgi:hypothetical protein
MQEIMAYSSKPFGGGIKNKEVATIDDGEEDDD